MELDKLSSVANKLAKVEATSKEQVAEINEKNVQLRKAQEELEVLKTIKMDRNELEYRKILEEGTTLQNENTAMKKFLTEKGFKWVGNDKPKPKSGLNEFQKEIDLEIIAKQIDKLNDQIEHESKYMRGKDGAHRLAVILVTTSQKPDPLPIGFYRNGVIIQGYKFHEYTSNEAHAILNDFLEGFFPSEIKTKYPNGTAFRIIDHTEDIYDVNHYMKQGNIQTVEKMYEQFRPYTKEEFLNQLPEKVISHGKVIPVRSEIAKKFGVIQEANEEREVVVNTNVVLEEGKGKVFSKDDIALLKVRSEKGKNTVIVRLLAKDCIASVYKYVEKYR